MPANSSISRESEPRILIVHKNPKADNPLACHAGLGVTASNTADVLIEHGFDAQSMAVVDGYYLRDKLATEHFKNVTHVVMCAPFFDTKFLSELCGRFPAIMFSIVFHSNVGFLGVDNWSTGVLSEQLALMPEIRNFQVAGNSAKFCDATEALYNQKCRFLPNLYFLHGPIQRQRKFWEPGSILRMGAFGATRQLKNLPTAAWAAAIISQKLNTEAQFWISSGREEGAGAGTVLTGIRKLFVSRSGIRLIEVPWEPWPDFRRNVVRRMHLMLQPSFTESFNGVTADGVAEGVPSVVSPSIDWVPSHWITVADDAVKIAEKGISLILDHNAPQQGYDALVRHNEMAIRKWTDFIFG